LLSAGICTTQQADEVVQGLVASGELVRLEGGRFTTRELRERELRAVEIPSARAREEVAAVSPDALRDARRGAAQQIGSPLSPEQREALELITGEGGVSILVGQAGTGKGVVLSAASSAWRSEGADVYGIAVAGATAERLGADAGIEQTMSADALLSRARSGRVVLSEKSVIVMDEAGMADTKRLADLVELSGERKSKLVLVGDEAQLPSIGAGGLFAELQSHVPSASLAEVHRARSQWKRDAWMQLREGRSQAALARYRAEGRLPRRCGRADARRLGSGAQGEPR
jgi:ATP-dependent exoDNAse (exonuclease V) alpha subunit